MPRIYRLFIQHHAVPLFDTPNTLAICVDNARQDIAPSPETSLSFEVLPGCLVYGGSQPALQPERTTARTVCSSAPRRFPEEQATLPYAVK